MEPAAAPEDVLSRLLASCRSERAVTARFTLAAPWALHSAGTEGLLIRVCTGAPYWIALEQGAAVQVQPRDIVMLPHGSAHTVSSAPGLPALAFRELIAQHQVGRHGDHPIVFRHGPAGGMLTELFSLHLWMPGPRRASPLAGLPPLLLLREREVAATASLALATEALANETLAQRPGWQLAAARMADLLLLHVLREHLAAGGAAASGWLRALNDAGIAPAVVALHAQPEHAWTVALLARECHLSRSVFSERFRAAMEATPMAYLTALRMGLAAEKLRDGRLGMARVAALVGYESEKAFARAYRRWTIGAQVRRAGGCGPTGETEESGSSEQR